MIINATTTRGYIQALSGFFINKDNPTGLSPREIDVLSALMFYAEKEDTTELTSIVKKSTATALGFPMQVITNYVKKFRDKKVLTMENKLHPILLSKAITVTFKNPIT